MRRIVIIQIMVLCYLYSNSRITVSDNYLLSPNAVGLGEYGEVPVSLHSGIPQIEIPIYEISYGGHRLPITLSYHGGGVRPNQHPGWVGVGWSLNAGGCISRVINGLPDETYYIKRNVDDESERGVGYFYMTDLYNGIYSTKDEIQYMVTPDPTVLYNYYYGKDSAPDLFSFNFCGISGSFMINNKGEWKVQCNRHIKVEFNIYESQYACFFNTSILAPNELNTNSLSHTIIGFTLIDDYGIRYIFGGDINSTEFSVGMFSQSTSSMTATSWMLKKIIYPSGESIDFNYVKRDYTVQLAPSSFKAQYQHDSPSFSIIIPQNNKFSSIDGSLISPSYLSSITFRGNSVQFDIAETRELKYDLQTIINMGVNSLPITQFELPYLRKVTADGKFRDGVIEYTAESLEQAIKWYKLKSIKVKDSSGNIVKQKDLSYNDEDSTTAGKERLALLSVADASEPTNVYRFEYFDTGSLPEYCTLRTDHCGYFNNQYISDNAFMSQDSYYVRKKPNHSYAKYGMLKKISYPTGGYSRFEYAANDYFKVVNEKRTECISNTYTTLGCGLRMAKIINSETGSTDDEIIVKEYQYTDSYDSDNSSGVLIYNPQYYAQGTVQSNLGILYKLNVWSSQSVLPMSGNSSEIHIGYTTVFEKNPDGSYSKYEFSNYDNGYTDSTNPLYLNYATSFYNTFSSRSQNRGLLLKKEDYDSTGVLKYRQQINYVSDNTSSVNCVNKKIYLLGNYEVYEEIYSYTQFLFSKFPKTMINTEYFVGGTMSSDTVSYNYDSKYKRKIKSEMKTIGNGQYEEITYKYPHDFEDIEYIQMENLYMISPIVESEKYIYEYVNEDSVAYFPINKTLNKYTRTNPESPYSISVSTKGGAYENRYKYEYDERNNIIAEQIDGGEQTVYIWGYNFRYIVGVIKNSTLSEIQSVMDLEKFGSSSEPDFEQLDKLKTNLPHIKITRYEYKPLIGISKIITDDGLVTQYYYDKVGRLSYIIDNEGNIKQSINYNYRIK